MLKKEKERQHKVYQEIKNKMSNSILDKKILYKNQKESVAFPLDEHF